MFIRSSTTRDNRLPKFGIAPAIQRIDELKVVFDMNYSKHITRDNARNLAACISYVKAHPKWKLSLQTHKILNIR